MNLVLFNHNYIYLIKRVNINFTFFIRYKKRSINRKFILYNKVYIVAIPIFFSVISSSYPSLRVEIIIPNPSSIDKPFLYLLSKF